MYGVRRVPRQGAPGLFGNSAPASFSRGSDNERRGPRRGPIPPPNDLIWPQGRGLKECVEVASGAMLTDGSHLLAQSHHQPIDLVVRFTKRLRTKRLYLTTRVRPTLYSICRVRIILGWPPQAERRLGGGRPSARQGLCGSFDLYSAASLSRSRRSVVAGEGSDRGAPARTRPSPNSTAGSRPEWRVSLIRTAVSRATSAVIVP